MEKDESRRAQNQEQRMVKKAAMQEGTGQKLER